MNGHNSEMTLDTTGSTLEYKCSHCSNTLDTTSFEKMLGHLHDKIIEEQLSDSLINLTEYKWKNRKGVRYKVLYHDGVKIEVGVLNTMAIKG